MSAPVLPDGVHTLGAMLSDGYTPLTTFGLATEPESPAWWLKTLADELTARRRRIEPLWDRYKGSPPLPELGSPSASRARERVWKAFQRKAHLNLEELIIRSIAERLTPIGARVDSIEPDAAPDPAVALRNVTGVADVLRIGQPPVQGPSSGDAVRNARARRVWVGNRMGVQSGEILEKMLVMGTSYAIVMAPEDDAPDVPVITAEDPRYVITYQDPARPARTMAALKLYHDPIRRRDVAWLYLPGRALRLERVGRDGTTAIGARRFRFDPNEWQIAQDRDLAPWIGMRVAVVPFENHDAEGEFENHQNHLDRINHMILQRIVIATLQAFKQRAVKGAPTHDPKTKEPIDYSDIFTNDPGALWLLPATAELWESGQVDLTGILTSTKDDVRDLAAVLRLPVQHFIPDAANGSAEGAASTKEGLIHRAEDRRGRADGPFADVATLAFGYLGDAEPATVTTLWRPIERFSLAEKSDASSKATGTVPWEEIMTDIWGYEPDDLPRLRQHRADDLMMAPAAAGDAGSRAAATSGGTGADVQSSSSGQSGDASSTNGGTGTNDRAAAGAGSPAGSSGS